jgi:hypothetical protein
MVAGEVALFRLPRSGVTISLGTRAFRDPLGAFAEIRGFLPDVRITGGDAAVQAALLARSATRGRPPRGEHDSAGPGRVESVVETRLSSWK